MHFFVNVSSKLASVVVVLMHIPGTFYSTGHRILKAIASIRYNYLIIHQTKVFISMIAWKIKAKTVDNSHESFSQSKVFIRYSGLGYESTLEYDQLEYLNLFFWKKFQNVSNVRYR